MFQRQSARLKSFKSNDIQFVKKISLQATYHVMTSHCQKKIDGQKILPFEKLGKCPMFFQAFAKSPSHL
jgi:hypothetical protein